MYINPKTKEIITGVTYYKLPDSLQIKWQFIPNIVGYKKLISGEAITNDIELLEYLKEETEE